MGIFTFHPPPAGGYFNNVHQAIVNATIAPEAGAISVTFQTVRPAKPIYTVWKNIRHDASDMTPKNQIVAAFESLTPTTTHSKRITGLPQGVPLWLRIDAAAEDVPVGDPRQPASFVTETGTLKRYCVITIASMMMLTSGGDPEGASMVFQAQIYNGDSGDPLTDGRLVDTDSIGNGEFVRDMVGTSFRIDRAPDVVVPYLAALHRTGGIFHVPTIGTGLPGVLPDEADVASGANDDYEWASCHRQVSLPVQGGDTTSTLMLGTDHKVPLITATLTIETHVQNTAGIALVIEAGSRRWF
jgi:hypothetical protein